MKQKPLSTCCRAEIDILLGNKGKAILCLKCYSISGLFMKSKASNEKITIWVPPGNEDKELDEIKIG